MGNEYKKNGNNGKQWENGKEEKQQRMGKLKENVGKTC